MPTTRRDIEALPVYDTPLHPTIELAHFRTTNGDRVIYDPDEYGEANCWLRSTIAFDTYDWR